MKELVYNRQLLPAVEHYPDKVGFIDGAYRATYAEHLDRVGRVASVIRELGISSSDRFAVMALNSHQFLELYHAAYLGAGVINPLNLRLAPKELAYILNDSGTNVCFTDSFFAGVVDQVRGEVQREEDRCNPGDRDDQLEGSGVYHAVGFLLRPPGAEGVGRRRCLGKCPGNAGSRAGGRGWCEPAQADGESIKTTITATSADRRRRS